MSDATASSNEYNAIIGRLQEALLRKQLSSEEYERLKSDVMHPAASVQDPIVTYNAAIHRLQKQLLKRRIDADTYDRLKNDLIRPDGRASRSDKPAPATSPPRLEARETPPPSGLVASAPPAKAVAAAEKARSPKVTFAVPSLRDLIEKHHEPGVHELIAQHPQLGENLDLLRSKMDELERKGEYTPIDLKTITAFDDMIRIAKEKAAGK